MTQYHTEHRPTIANIVEWFRKAKPIQKSADLGIQMGVHFEEVGEMTENIGGIGTGAEHLIYKAEMALKALAKDMKERPGHYYVPETKRVAFLDALCDQIVTTCGTGFFAGMNIEGALDHVDDSNWSKFVDGEAVFTEHGKIAKGPNYFKPDLYKFV